ncbi:Isocitrate lyase (plasmid) [Bradyrhizobium diazoefficiens]|uniref:Isocitrate lyase n=1 Tax=Bradyrhizobium diazoefficiens TaxID=1355477 RepID=A0A0E4G179_9BRAD|nr:Isocitrate lyase [Bradyrhizobium diazoefficiens]
MTSRLRPLSLAAQSALSAASINDVQSILSLVGKCVAPISLDGGVKREQDGEIVDRLLDALASLCAARCIGVR